MAKDSTRAINHFASLNGTTGLIQTPDANTVGRFHGNIGVFENLHSDSLDNLVFCFGVHSRIEVGIHSDIPTRQNPRMNFFFKIKGSDEGTFLGLHSDFLPSTAFGIQRNSAFAVTTYEFRLLSFSAGYSFSDETNGIFANAVFYPFSFVTLQCEYINETAGVSIRAQYNGIEISIVYIREISQRTFTKENAYWRVAYNF